jgi:hypothetical protein
MTRLAIRITAPFEIGDAVALVHREGDSSQRIVLRGGRFDGDVSGHPDGIQLLLDAAPPGEKPLAIGDANISAIPEGPPVDAEQLFNEGTAIPDNGTLICQIVWGSSCHSEQTSEAGPERRFASFEHFMCADYIGRSGVSQAARFEVDRVPAGFTNETPLPIGDKELTFGQIIALAGDYYAFLDSEAAQNFSWAWPDIRGFKRWLSGDYRSPTIDEDTDSAVGYIFGIIMRDKDSERGTAGEIAASAADSVAGFPVRRYAALASQNFCHFRETHPEATGSIDAMSLYYAYHARALIHAARPNVGNPNALLRRALAIDAFGCHFLTDSFASGHMRVPRRELARYFGLLLGSLKMSKAMHDEDNKLGLWCATQATASSQHREIWRAYGDGRLRSDEARVHRKQVQEAVRRSSGEVFTAWVKKQASPAFTAPVAEVLPVLLPPGDGPSANDKSLDGNPFPDLPPNHEPMYALDSKREWIFR